MLVDPMTSPEQAEAEADEQQDEARREQHYAEAEQAARCQLETWCANSGIQAVQELLMFLEDEPRDDDERTLRAFNADYGTPALLRVIANALEAK